MTTVQFVETSVSSGGSRPSGKGGGGRSSRPGDKGGRGRGAFLKFFFFLLDPPLSTTVLYSGLSPGRPTYLFGNVCFSNSSENIIGGRLHKKVQK